VREILKTHQICTIVRPTKRGQTLRIRKASTPEKAVAVLYTRLGLSHQVIKPTYQWTDSLLSDQKPPNLLIYGNSNPKNAEVGLARPIMASRGCTHFSAPIP
jgi:hypothetical protein